MTRTRMLIAAVAAGLAIVAVLVGMSMAGGHTSPASSTVIAQGPETAALLAGIPQHGDTLGAAGAPVTLVEYADLQCPYCGEFARGTLPTLIRDYVRPGKVRLVFRGLQFVGADSEAALRAVVAAGRQDKLWSYGELMYQNQGTENTGWVTEDLIKTLGAAVPGLDVSRMLADRPTQAVSAAIATAAGFANVAGIQGTPSFEIGKTGGTMQPLSVSTLDPSGFTPVIDRLLAS